MHHNLQAIIYCLGYEGGSLGDKCAISDASPVILGL
jgi:hypothetical protein